MKVSRKAGAGRRGSNSARHRRRRSFAAAAGSGQARPAAVKVAHRRGHRRPQRQGLQHPCRAGSQQGREGARQSRPASTRRNRRRTARRTCSAAAQAGYELVIANGVLFTFGPLNTVAPAFPNTKFLGIDVDFTAVEGQAEERPRRPVQRSRRPAASSATSRRSRSSARASDVISAVGANKVTAIVRFFAGYNLLREAGVPEGQGARPTTRTTRPSTTRRSAGRPRSARSPAARRSSSRSPAAAASVRSTRPSRRRSLGHRRRRRPALPRPAHPDERDEEGERRGLRRDQGVQRRIRHAFKTRLQPATTP